MSQAAETRVPCSEKTRDRLRAVKVGGETYDDVMNRLLERAGGMDALTPDGDGGK